MDTLIKSGLWILVYFDLICPQHDALYFAIISYNHFNVSNEKSYIKLCLKVPLNLTFFEILSTNKIVDFTLLLFMSTYGIVIKFVLTSVGYNHKIPRKN